MTEIDDFTELRGGYDILVGGFPCQSFSIAGHRRGFDDTRGTMFFELARILEQTKPPLCLFENVKGLLSHDVGRTFETILKTMDELGYDVEWQVLNSKDFGVPQKRERVYIVGHLRGQRTRKVFFNSGTRSEVNTGVKSRIIQTRKYKSNKRDYPQEYRVYNPKGISPTLSTAQGGGTQPHIEAEGRTRRLTPREYWRLQGFPDYAFDQAKATGLSDRQLYKQAGNAVTVNVVKWIGERMWVEK